MHSLCALWSEHGEPSRRYFGLLRATKAHEIYCGECQRGSPREAESAGNNDLSSTFPKIYLQLFSLVAVVLCMRGKPRPSLSLSPSSLTARFGVGPQQQGSLLSKLKQIG